VLPANPTADETMKSSHRVTKLIVVYDVVYRRYFTSTTVLAADRKKFGFAATDGCFIPGPGKKRNFQYSICNNGSQMESDFT